MDETTMLKYSVGALMYSPALNEKTADKIISGEFGHRYSVAFCLEDSIDDSALDEAEKTLARSLKKLSEADIPLPMIFIRVRECGHAERLFRKIKPYSKVFKGFIFPKYTLSNAEKYNSEIIEINRLSDTTVYMMPILESGDIVDLSTRVDTLCRIKEYIDSVRDYVLNVRVGGNDFSNQFAVRRHVDETIYDIKTVSDIMGNILAVFSKEYVVSGPVWEFFSDAEGEWEKGLRNELKLDVLNGFVGKTVIHPNQIPVVNDMLKVSRADYEDAGMIVNWSDKLQVGKSFGGQRMNEVRTNYNWAVKTMILSEIYGVKENE